MLTITLQWSWFVFQCIFNTVSLILKPCRIHCQMMKSYIWLQTADGSIQQVEQEVAMFCPMICHEVIQKGMGSSKNYAISLPQRVNPAMLSLILDYCRFHQVPGRSNKVGSMYFSIGIYLLCLMFSSSFLQQMFNLSGSGINGANYFPFFRYRMIFFVYSIYFTHLFIFEKKENSYLWDIEFHIAN